MPRLAQIITFGGTCKTSHYISGNECRNHNIEEDLAVCDRYDPEHVCNHSDDDGRYSYEAQPGVCLWNCEKLAEALAPVLDPSMARAQLDTLFTQEYTR